MNSVVDLVTENCIYIDINITTLSLSERKKLRPRASWQRKKESLLWCAFPKNKIPLLYIAISTVHDKEQTFPEIHSCRASFDSSLARTRSSLRGSCFIDP